ncbi:MAG: ABC transporter permease [Dysgonomonas sp.]|nr:ABC transporter permease [Dysgonomonas sp.]
MKTLKHLLKKEFLQIFRNKFLLRLIFMMPIIQLAILPWAATFDQKDISLCIVDNDKSTFSTQLREKVLSSGFFKLSSYSFSYDKALSEVESGDADLILEIPHDFEKKFISSEPSEVMLSIDALNGQKAGLGMSYMTQIINDFNASKQSNSGLAQPMVSIKPYYKYNVEMSYHNFMVPGILVILVSMLIAMLSSMNIVREREIGTMEQINVTPVSKGTFILAKLIPFWIIGIFLLTIGIFIAWLIYGLIPLGSFANIYIFAFVYMLAFSGFGLMISNFAKSQQQAMFMVIFFLITFILLSGLFTPISSMPEWAQTITLFNPLRYFIEVMRLIYLKGSGFMDILPHLLNICIFLVVFNVLAVLTYRKTSN